MPVGSAIPPDGDLNVLGDQHGNAVLTVPLRAERYRINSFWPRSKMNLTGAAILQMEAKFDPTQLSGGVELLENGMKQRVKDRAGRVATLEEAEFVLKDNQLTIHLQLPRESREPAIVLRGRVLDDKKQPLAGAEAKLAFRYKQGGIMSAFHATTNARGEFQLPGIKRSDGRITQGGSVSVVVRKTGYAGVESRKLYATSLLEEGQGDFGTIELQPGYTLHGQVVNDAGQPVEGAYVVNLTNYFLYGNLSCRTDAAGRFTMDRLNLGKQQISVSYGMQNVKVTHELKGDGETVQVKLGGKKR